MADKRVWNSPAAGCSEELEYLQSSRHLFQRSLRVIKRGQPNDKHV